MNATQLERQRDVLELFAEQAAWFRDTSAPWWTRIMRERAELRRLYRREYKSRDQLLMKLWRMKRPCAVIPPLPRPYRCAECGEAWGTSKGLAVHRYRAHAK